MNLNTFTRKLFMQENNIALSNLQDKLKEIFEIQNSDLDFGIYRIMKFREKEIQNFIESELPEIIDLEIQKLDSNSSQKSFLEQIKKFENKAENKDLINVYKSGNTGEIETASKYNADFKDYVSHKDTIKGSSNAQIGSDDIYNWVHTFFSSYYDKGDFFKTRKQKGTYKFQGGDVGFTWSTEGQYYIKSGKHFNIYSFYLANKEKTKITFELLETKEAQNNNKDKCKIVFGGTKNIICEETGEILESLTDIQIKDDGNEIVLFFEHKEGDSKTNGENIFEVLKKSPYATLSVYLKEKKTEKSNVLQYHLTRFDAESKRDFFIHKDLKGFLTTELDSFIAGVITEKQAAILGNVTLAAEVLRKLEVLKNVAGTIIDFIAGVEEYQKTIFEKKKFIVESEYCMTLDRVPEMCYEEIASNELQKEEWKKLGFIDDVKVINTQYLKDHQTLVLDTKFFPKLKFKILSNFESLDEQTDGLLINSENFQVLNLLLEKYRGKVKCIYIDPPFNLGQNGDFYYKTNYLNSSWCSLLEDRLLMAKEFLSDDGSIFVRCDYHGNYLVRQLLDKIFGEENFMNEIVISTTHKIFSGLKKYNTASNALFFYTKKKDNNYFEGQTKKRKTVKWQSAHSGGERNPPERVFLGKQLFPQKGRHWTFVQSKIDEMSANGRIRINGDKTYIDMLGSTVVGMPEYLLSEDELLTSSWLDISGYSNTTGFPTENSEILLKRVIETATKPGDVVMDFFAGSATTQTVAQKLGRKWIGSEMGDYFYTYPFTRLQNTIFGLQKGISKEKDVNYKGIGAFKYFRLEQYEDTLNNLKAPQKIESQTFLNTELDRIVYEMQNNETGCVSVMNNDEFIRKPFNQTMKIGEDDEKSINFVDTFNYLLGITVNKIRSSSDESYICIFGEKELQSGKRVKYVIIWLKDQMNVTEKFKEIAGEYSEEFENADSVYCNQQVSHPSLSIKDIYPEFYEKMFKAVSN